MDKDIIFNISKKLENGIGVALVTLIEIDGSSPGRKGNLMGVFQTGEICGTVGGGNLEFKLIKEALKAIEENKSKSLEFDLIEEAALHMACGGKVKAFIKVFEKKEKLIVIGGGHIGSELYKLGDYLGFEIVMIDDREEFCNSEKYPNAKNIVGNLEEITKNLKLDEYSFVVIVSRGHLGDKVALKGVLGRGAKYIGMIGSRSKVKKTFNELEKEGIPVVELEKVYSPIGLDISSGSPKEIGVSIISEILKIKNNLSGYSLKEKIRYE